MVGLASAVFALVLVSTGVAEAVPGASGQPRGEAAGSPSVVEGLADRMVFAGGRAAIAAGAEHDVAGGYAAITAYEADHGIFAHRRLVTRPVTDIVPAQPVTRSVLDLALGQVVIGSGRDPVSADTGASPVRDATPAQLVAQASGNFFLYEFEQQSGPFSVDELIEQISRGDIGKSAYVWQPGFDAWVPIDSITEFAAAFPQEIELPRPYYVIEDGTRVGPLSESEMQVRIIELLSGAEDLAWKAGLAGWTPLRDFPEFADQLAAAQVPPLPGRPASEEPPPLPGDVKLLEPHGGDVIDEALWARLEDTLEREMPRIMDDATAREQRAATACLLDLLRPGNAALWQLLVDSEMEPSDEQVAQMDRLDPGFVAAAGRCIEDAQAMKDMLDAMIWNAVSERLPEGPAELQLRAYKCMKEATEVLSREHRELIIAEGGTTISDQTIALMEESYPGISDKVETCEAMVAGAPGTPAGGGSDDVARPLKPLPDGDGEEADRPLRPLPGGGGKEARPLKPLPDGDNEDVTTPIVPLGDDDGGTDAGTGSGADKPQPPVVERPEVEGPDPLTATVRKSLAQQGMPPYLIDITAGCFAGRLRAVITTAEEQAIIAEGLTDAIGARLEAAHPGISESMAGCVPRNF